MIFSHKKKHTKINCRKYIYVLNELFLKSVLANIFYCIFETSFENIFSYFYHIDHYMKPTPQRNKACCAVCFTENNKLSSITQVSLIAFITSGSPETRKSGPPRQIVSIISTEKHTISQAVPQSVIHSIRGA